MSRLTKEREKAIRRDAGGDEMSNADLHELATALCTMTTPSESIASEANSSPLPAELPRNARRTICFGVRAIKRFLLSPRYARRPRPRTGTHDLTHST